MIIKLSYKFLSDIKLGATDLHQKQSFICNIYWYLLKVGLM